MAERLLDPTRPIVGAGNSGRKADEGLKLDSILIARSRKLAVINGDSISEGESVNGVLVRRISAGEVEVSYQGKIQTLALVPGVRSSAQKAR